MSNLIITILGVALAAITALLGLLFLSPVMDNYFNSSKASALMSNLQQIQQAANAYIADQSQNYFSVGDVNDLSRNLGNLTPTYFSSWPDIINSQITQATNTFSGGGYYIQTKYACDNDLQKTIFIGTDRVKVNTTQLYFIKNTGCSFDFFATPSGTFAANDNVVKICQKINQTVTVPSGVTLDGITGLPQGTAAVTGLGGAITAYGYNNSSAVLPLRNGCFISSDRKAIMIFYAN